MVIFRDVLGSFMNMDTLQINRTLYHMLFDFGYSSNYFINQLTCSNFKNKILHTDQGKLYVETHKNVFLLNSKQKLLGFQYTYYL